MPPTTTERIEQEADLFAGGNYTHNHFPVNYQNRHAGYIVGATSEANRSKVLVEALEDVKKSCPVGSWFEKRITKALNTYNRLKKKEEDLIIVETSETKTP